MEQTAKLLTKGKGKSKSQTVLLPVSFRFDANEVFIRQDPQSGDVILSRKPFNWDSFLAAIQPGIAPSDFLDATDRDQAGQVSRDPFADWHE